MIFGPEQSTGHSAHIGEEVEVYYRWHPLHGRRLRRQYGERRLGGQCVHVEASPGVVVAIAAWMLDPIACAGMVIGTPRVAVSALADLHQLLIGRGFRGSSVVDSRIVKEEQNEQFAKVGSANASAEQDPSSTQPRVQFHPVSIDEPDGADEGDRQLGDHSDASGGSRNGGAHR
jgi:hypothetical protein